MNQGNLFSESHPAILFFYFLLVITTTMLMAHPVVIGISFLAAISYRFCFQKRKQFFIHQILYLFPVYLLIIFFNTAFQHYGITPLYYLKTGAITLESIVYGAVLGLMLWSSILWFSSVHLIFTTDKIIYLFGQVFPVLGLFFSMVFRFVPRFREKWHRIREGQAYLGKDIYQQKFLGKIKCAVSEISILLSWALESSLHLVDSMRARGYGAAKRTTYVIYSFHAWDLRITVIGMLFFLGSVFGFYHGIGKSQYDPWIQLGGFPLTLTSFLSYFFWTLFCFYPVLVSGFGVLYYKSRNRETLFLFFKHSCKDISDQNRYNKRDD